MYLWFLYFLDSVYFHWDYHTDGELCLQSEMTKQSEGRFKPLQRGEFFSFIELAKTEPFFSSL